MSVTSQLLTTFLVNSLWQIPLIAVAAALCARLMGRAPFVYRHTVWVVALALCLGLPLTSLWGLTGAGGGVNSVLSRASATGGGDSDGQGKLAHKRFSFTRGKHIRPVSLPPLLTSVLVGCYAGFLLYRAARIAWSLRCTLRLRNAGYLRALPGPLSVLANRCARTFALSDVAIVCSPDTLGPVTLSFPDPTLILPERFFTEVSEPDFSSALCHELAHIKRRDFLFNLLYEFVSMPVAFHPATEWIKKRIALTRELACDEAAAAKLSTRSGYARSLLNIAQSLDGSSPQTQSNWALGLFDTNTLEERIMNLLGKANCISRKRRIVLTMATASLLAVACAGISAFSLQIASPTTSSADVQQFAGKWSALHEGTPFIVLELRLEKGQLTGGMRMASNFHIDTDGSGPAIQINDKTLLDTLPARNFKVTGKSLTFDYKDYDGDDTRWRLDVGDTNTGRLGWIELPNGMKAATIPVTKETATAP